MPRVTGLEHLTLLALSPPDLVTVAARAGFSAVGLRLSPATDGERRWPVAPGSPMLAETALRCADTGVAVLDAEAVRLGAGPAPGPGAGRADVTPVLDAAAALGARYINAICEDADLNRLSDEFAGLVETARPYQIRPVIEFMAYRSVHTLAAASAVAARSGGGGILIDALHVQRCTVGLDAVRKLDPGLVTYVQLCDAPLAAPADQVAEARSARLLPGDGELPLAELLAALPSGLPVAVEAPQAGAAEDPVRFAARARRGLESVLSQSLSRSKERP